MRYRIGDRIQNICFPEIRGNIIGLNPPIFMCECPDCNGRQLEVGMDCKIVKKKKIVCDTFDKDGEE